MQLLFLLLPLMGTYSLLTFAGRRIPNLELDLPTRARVSLTLFFAFTALGHFIRTKEMAMMLPPFIPHRIEIIYITGVLELLGDIGMWIPRFRRLTGICLILMLIAILPSNIYAAFARVNFGGHGAGPIYLLVRVPFQFFVICWTYVATELDWLPARAEEDWTVYTRGR